MTRKMFVIFVMCFYILIVAANPIVADSVKDCIDGQGGCPELNDNQGPEEMPANDNDSSKTGADTNESGGSLIWNLIKMAFALVIILALIYGLLYFLSRRHKMFSKIQALENMGGISVGQNKSMQIVRIGKRYYVVGVGNNVELLHEITDEAIIQDLKSDQQTETVPFNRLLPRFKQKQTKQEHNTFRSLFTKELEQMKQSRKQLIDKHKDDRHE